MPFIFAGSIVFLVILHTGSAQNAEELSSYGVPEEPVIQDSNILSEEHGGDEGGHHHHGHGHSDNPLDWLRESIPGTMNQ